jgi:hypothetical protein
MKCLFRHRGEADVQLLPIHNPAKEGGGYCARRHCTGGWVGLGTGLDGMENLASTGVRSADRPDPGQ